MTAFQKNTVRLPPKLNKSEEENLALFKAEAFSVIEKEISKTKNSSKYKTLQCNISKARKYMNDKQMIAIPSDKTNRVVVTNQTDYIKDIEEMLQDPETYKQLQKSKSKALEKQANKIVRSVCQGTGFEPDIPKLLSNGSQPAKFSAFIKDHKHGVGKYPLRPIASVIHTPTEKVDWLVSSVISQLLQFIPAHLKSSKELIDIFTQTDKSKVKPEQVFISLDVVQLYPSIPIHDAIQAILDLAAANWSNIDTKGLTIEDLSKCLKFISYN